MEAMEKGRKLAATRDTLLAHGKIDAWNDLLASSEEGAACLALYDRSVEIERERSERFQEEARRREEEAKALKSRRKVAEALYDKHSGPGDGLSLGELHEVIWLLEEMVGEAEESSRWDDRT